MGKKTPPFGAYPTWTEARFWAFVRSALRKAHTNWPPAQEVMRQGRRTVTGKRHKYEHECAECKEWFQEKYIEKDHLVPVGTLKTWEHLPEFVRKLFVSVDGYRKLCKPCHAAVTYKETLARIDNGSFETEESGSND